MADAGFTKGNKPGNSNSNGDDTVNHSQTHRGRGTKTKPGMDRGDRERERGIEQKGRGINPDPGTREESREKSITTDLLQNLEDTVQAQMRQIRGNSPIQNLEDIVQAQIRQIRGNSPEPQPELGERGERADAPNQTESLEDVIQHKIRQLASEDQNRGITQGGTNIEVESHPTDHEGYQ